MSDSESEDNADERTSLMSGHVEEGPPPDGDPNRQDRSTENGPSVMEVVSTPPADSQNSSPRRGDHFENPRLQERVSMNYYLVSIVCTTVYAFSVKNQYR